ncbi:hypothetical protein [Mucilaginibacter paludis]|uniref:Uncharacterized protein n=1 Tax=Mucilaginibacter paludis DSM 18603 TaxID=714943 RepID=H1YI22_9SPHI|nr:hypothetical protein [Mucilaginibacter paludis]EHQ25570.1 hypothetical protein Mucpa_1410 [Mucilaginibacter paludis DSM 18603]
MNYPTRLSFDILTNTFNRIEMEASGDETNLEQIIDEVFGPEPFGPVEEQLLKWLAFLLTGNGGKISCLDELNYNLFKEKLDVLLPAVYRWHVEKINHTQ